MRDPPTVTEPLLVCSSRFKCSIFADGSLAAAASLPLGATSSANAVAAASIAPTARRQMLFIIPSPLLGRRRVADHEFCDAGFEAWFPQIGEAGSWPV